MDRLKKFYKKNKRLLLVDLLLIFVCFFYYLFFINRVLVLSDEGYYVHFAERIAHGEIPYKDFALQYTPGYFYLLAFLYKIFGVQILVGRFVSLIICLLILTVGLLLLHLYKIKSIKIHVLAAFVVIVLGYPLLHIPLIIWACVLMAVLMQVCFLLWLRSKKLLYIVLLGILLGLCIFFRHSIGIVFIALVNGLIFLSGGKDWLFKAKSLLVLNSVWIFITALWIYYFFVYAYTFFGLFILFEFSRNFAQSLAFSYPSLTLLLQPTGFFKLLPYYFPIIYAVIVLKKVFVKKPDWEKLSFAFFVLCGFFATVYPASDLLHVYPFLGLIVVSSIILFHKKKGFVGVSLLAVCFILIGIYLTFFMQSFRYEGYFLRATTPIHLPKTQGMLIDKDDRAMANLVPLYNFINQHTKKDDYIFVYPFSPLLYTLLDRQNPTGIVQFIFLDAPSSIYPEKRVIKEIKEKKVQYFILVGGYNHEKELAQFIRQQKKVLELGPYVVFEIKK